MWFMCSCGTFHVVLFLMYFFSDHVWLVSILGHFFIHWGAKRAGVQSNGRQLGISRSEVSIGWIYVLGLLRGRVIPEVHKVLHWDRALDVLILHTGGNDLGVRSSRHIIWLVKFDILRLRMAFPHTVVVWLDIVGHTSWRFARSVDKLNRASVKINKEVVRFIVCNGGFVVRHRELEVDTLRYLRSDSVHLNSLGTDFWFLGLQDGVQRALRF